MPENIPVWLVDRTFSDDEQNIIIVTYASADGALALRKELAVPVVGTGVDIPCSDTAVPADLTPVADPTTRAWYASAVTECRETANADTY